MTSPAARFEPRHRLNRQRIRPIEEANLLREAMQFAGWQRRPLADVLRLAGFAVDVHDRTLSIGSDIGSAVELDRVRRASGGAN